MKEEKFRKLDIDLPTEPLRNQRPWLVAGWLFVFAIMLLAVCAYFMV